VKKKSSKITFLECLEVVVECLEVVMECLEVDRR